MNLITHEKLNKLIGIPFAIGREDFEACDCVGICWLYLNSIHGFDFPHRDGKCLKFRDPKNDEQRIITVIETFCHQIGFNELREKDFILMRDMRTKLGCLGVMIDQRNVLHMNRIYGSCLIKKSEIKQTFYRGYRINDK